MSLNCMIPNELHSFAMEARTQCAGYGKDYGDGEIAVYDNRFAAPPLVNLWAKIDNGEGWGQLPPFHTFDGLIITFGTAEGCYGGQKIMDAFPDLFFNSRQTVRLLPGAGIPVIDMNTFLHKSPDKILPDDKELVFGPKMYTNPSCHYAHLQVPGFLNAIWAGMNLITSNDVLFIMDNTGEWNAPTLGEAIRADLNERRIHRKFRVIHLDALGAGPRSIRDQRGGWTPMMNRVMRDIELRLGVTYFTY